MRLDKRFNRRLTLRGLSLSVALSAAGAHLAAGVLTQGALMRAAYALTVDNIIGMHSAKLPPEAIIATIKSTGATFNLTKDDLKRLKTAGVPQSVIDAMSPSRATPEPEPEPEPEPTPAVTQVNEEEQRRIQEAVEKEKARIREERVRQINAALARYDAMLSEGRFVEALKGFDEYMNSGEQSPEGLAKARFGLAEALFGLGLYANAMVIYEEILQTSPDENPVFEKAFYRFRECVQMISYDGLPGALTDHYVGNFSATFQDQYNYVLGKLFFASADLDNARLYLEKVAPGSADYVRAQYVLGLSAVKDAAPSPDAVDPAGLIKANRYFQEAITASEGSAFEEELARVVHLSYLSLARIAYKLGDDNPAAYDAALFYYRKVPTNSTHYVEALYESAWAYFLKGNVRRGMGIFHTLEGPDWEHHYLPDTHLLEAQVFLNLCRTGLAKEAVARLKSKYLDLRDTLALYIDTYEDSVYSAFVHKKLKNNIDLPRRIYLSVISHPDFFDAYARVSKYSREVVQIQENQSNFGDDLTLKLLTKARDLENSGLESLSISLLRILRERKEELDRLEEQMTEMQIGIDQQEAERLEDEIAQGYQGKLAEEAASAASQESAGLLVGEKYLTWPFEGEFWADEINNYRSYLTSQCKEEE
jgi:tetratricopeptide (TPR) repeat protein